jgi:lipopolysaccharide transport protein LptA
MSTIKTIIAISIFFSGIFAHSSFASSDDELPMQLKSDTATCRRQKDESICAYSGNATLVQGSTNLQAQQIVIYKKTGSKINKIVASGKHSHYSTALDSNQPIEADADLITLYPNKNTMILEKNGKMVAGQDKYSGPYIEYKFK